MIETIYVNAVAGAVGQLIRAALGVKKAIDEDHPIQIKKVVYTTMYGMVCGALVGLLVDDWKFALLTGLSATDVTESLIQILKG